MIRAAVIGFGQFADVHISKIHMMITGVQVGTICNRNEIMPAQAAIRFGGAACYTTAPQRWSMAQSPDAIRITTLSRADLPFGKLAVAHGARTPVPTIGQSTAVIALSDISSGPPGGLIAAVASALPIGIIKSRVNTHRD